jgi:glycine/D-amino acid oxidase-like deaminating enzyme
MLAPETATRAFAEAARQHGAIIRTGLRVGRLPSRSGRLSGGLITDEGIVSADAVVVAAGPWLPDLLPHVPVAAGRGWLMRTARLPWRLPWIIEEISWPDQDVLGSVTRSPSLGEVERDTFGAPAVQAFVLAPLADGSALLGASLAPSLRDAVEGVDAPQLLAARARAIAPALSDVPVARAWSGLRPMTPDGLPIAGKTLIEGVWLHGGHGSLGMQAAPATAEWLAATIVGSDPPVPELSWLEPERILASSRPEES